MCGKHGSADIGSMSAPVRQLRDGRDMRNSLSRISSIVYALVVLGCAGEIPTKESAPTGPKTSTGAQYNLVDVDNNGVADALDLTGDLVPDLMFGPGNCDDPLVDADGDGVPEGI